MRTKKLGFSLIELMVVIAIIAVLAMIAIPAYHRYVAKAKRAEAYTMLRSLFTAQKIYWAEHGTYSSALQGADSVGWQPEGYSGGGAQESFYYTYGFPGAEGKNYFSGKLGANSGDLSQANAGQKTFLALAAADIDGDGKPDILGIDEKNKITILQDDLAD